MKNAIRRLLQNTTGIHSLTQKLTAVAPTMKIVPKGLGLRRPLALWRFAYVRGTATAETLTPPRHPGRPKAVEDYAVQESKTLRDYQCRLTVAAALTGGSKWTRVVRMGEPGILTKRILVVDDDDLVCHSIGMMLAVDGHQIETAANGEEALACFEIGKFDVVLTDYEMPVMKGDRLAAAIKALAPDQPIGMVTGYAEAIQSASGSLPESIWSCTSLSAWMRFARPLPSS